MHWLGKSVVELAEITTDIRLLINVNELSIPCLRNEPIPLNKFNQYKDCVEQVDRNFYKAKSRAADRLAKWEKVKLGFVGLVLASLAATVVVAGLGLFGPGISLIVGLICGAVFLGIGNKRVNDLLR